METSVLHERYAQAINRESAHEKLTQRARERIDAAAAPAPRETRDDEDTPRPVGRGRESAGEALVKSVLRAAGSQIGRQIVRGILGSLLGGRR